MIKSINAFLGVMVFISSCALMPNTTSQFSPISTDNNSYERSEGVALFFEGEVLPKDYVKIGTVQALGHRFASDEEVLNYLKYKAWINGANSIILVRRETVTLTDNEFFEDEGEDANEYLNTSFSGIATRIQERIPLDSGFVSYVEKRERLLDDQKQDSAGFLIVGIGIAMGIILLAPMGLN